MSAEVKCHRCEGDGKAHGADRCFEGPQPGPCPVCNGTGLETMTIGNIAKEDRYAIEEQIILYLIERNKG